ncbi:hypothetical protein EVG20_g10809 [Dentipellis fragilis]|uniref:NAD-dependent epimerase/dehydratase domain-containing protein n=1 Tax=Dentipellis fragilis TaxID=205917 RepID=A0A4Y9XP24_9AGAM|nr:hypothetical protein EVG20_g10809 [Dentipellis fragilis]
MDQLVVVTGASGFVGSHLVVALLKGGYRVRLLARGERAKLLERTVVQRHNRAELFTITDIATDDLGPAFQGASAIFHVATPLAGRADVRTALESAVRGTLNVLEYSAKQNITKVVLTGSTASCRTPGVNDIWTGKVYTEEDWGHVTEEQVLDGSRDAMWIYSATKILAERAAWDFAERHHEVDITSLNFPFIYGPFADGFPTPQPSALGANRLLYQLIVGEKDRPLPLQLPPSFCDVRDVATAHIRALQIPLAKDVQSKRILVSGGYFLWKDAVDYLQEVRPQLSERLPSTKNAPTPPGSPSIISNSRAEAVLGFSSYIDWKRTLVETIDDLLRAEKLWASGTAKA